MAEKLSLCSEHISIRDLAATMFGLQGLDSSSQEVKQLVSALVVKLAAADEVDATSLGNCLYSLQVNLIVYFLFTFISFYFILYHRFFIVF